MTSPADERAVLAKIIDGPAFYDEMNDFPGVTMRKVAALGTADAILAAGFTRSVYNGKSAQEWYHLYAQAVLPQVVPTRDRIKEDQRLYGAPPPPGAAGLNRYEATLANTRTWDERTAIFEALNLADATTLAQQECDKGHWADGTRSETLMGMRCLGDAPGAAAEGAPVTDLCDRGHVFAHHQEKEPRCPFCLAIGLDTARDDLARANQMHEAACQQITLTEKERDRWRDIAETSSSDCASAHFQLDDMEELALKLRSALAELVAAHMREREAMDYDEGLAFNLRQNRAWAAARAALGSEGAA